jgi:hypothetical protein
MPFISLNQEQECLNAMFQLVALLFDGFVVLGFDILDTPDHCMSSGPILY